MTRTMCLFMTVVKTVMKQKTPNTIFFKCKVYKNERIKLFNETRHLHPINCKTLLFGNENLTHDENITIVNAVHSYIRNTKRFKQL